MADSTSSKKKQKRSVPAGQLHVQATFNNTIISFSDKKGNVLSQSSAGAVGFRGSKKGTAYAAQIAADRLFISVIAPHACIGPAATGCTVGAHQRIRFAWYFVGRRCHHHWPFDRTAQLEHGPRNRIQVAGVLFCDWSGAVVRTPPAGGACKAGDD